MSDRYLTFIDIFKDYPISRFLDIGCGDGSFGAVLKEQLGIKEVYGLDISELAVKTAKENGIIADVANIDSQDLPYRSDFFDAIFCGEVIEHIYSPDHLLSESYRILAPSGLLVMTTPNLASWFNRISLLLGYQPIFSDISLDHSYGHLWPLEPMGHLRLYTHKALVKLIEAYNFRILKTLGIGINYKIGFGQRHRLLARIANTIFKGPSINSGILVVAVKDSKD